MAGFISSIFNAVLEVFLSILSSFLFTAEGFSSTMISYITNVFAVGYQINTFFPLDTLLTCLGIVVGFELILLFVRIATIVVGWISNAVPG